MRKQAFASNIATNITATAEYDENEPEKVKVEGEGDDNRRDDESGQDIDETEAADIANGTADASRKSFSTSQSLASSVLAGNVRVVTETFSSIVYEMKICLVALAMNSLLLFLVLEMQNQIVIPFDASVISHYGGVVMEIILLMSNVLTTSALQQAGCCVFGYLIASKKGFSLAVCGFLEAPVWKKLKFAHSLSLTSSARKTLERVSIFWIVLELLKILTPFCAIALYSENSALFNDVSDCMYFLQDTRTRPTDRKFPTLDVEVGVGEYVFGSSIGIMRSENNINITTAMMPPTLISPVNMGDTIVGPGFTADISTTCNCAANASVPAFIATGVDPSQAQEVLRLYQQTFSTPSIVFGIVVDAIGGRLTISNVLGGYDSCGGAVGNAPLPIVCSTTISNHQNANVMISFSTDGTTASISPNVVSLLETKGPADVPNWLAFGFTSLIGGTTASYRLPPQIPGQLATLLWWTSPNLISIDRGLLEPGIETMYSILFKAAIQRVYQTKGMQCPRQNVLTSHKSVVKMQGGGLDVTVALLLVQCLISFMSVAVFILWMTAPSPIGPAVRCMREYIYFLTLFASSHVTVGFSELGNADTYVIWQELDTIVRIGESLHTLEAPVGQIVIDKPNLVRPLTNGKKYT